MAAILAGLQYLLRKAIFIAYGLCVYHLSIHCQTLRYFKFLHTTLSVAK